MKINNCPTCDGTGKITYQPTCYCMSMLEGDYCLCDTSYEDDCPDCLGTPTGSVLIELTSDDPPTSPTTPTPSE
jgi:hypothetical protein